MKKLLLILAASSLVGCASPPSFLAAMYDNNDPCQLQNNGGKIPSFCGASNSRAYIYTPGGNRVGYIQK